MLHQNGSVSESPCHSIACAGGSPDRGTVRALPTTPVREQVRVGGTAPTSCIGHPPGEGSRVCEKLDGARNALPEEMSGRGPALSCTGSEQALSSNSHTHRRQDEPRALTLPAVLHNTVERATQSGSRSSPYQNNVSKHLLLLTVLPLSLRNREEFQSAFCF